MTKTEETKEGLKLYQVTAVFEYTEIRTITAKTQKDAEEQIRSGNYNQVLESGSFGSVISIENIDDLKPSCKTCYIKNCIPYHENKPECVLSYRTGNKINCDLYIPK